MREIVAIVSDLHCNSSVAIRPPKFRTDDNEQSNASQAQKWLWHCWKQYWNEVLSYKKRFGWPVTIIVNGEAVDLNKHSAVQHVTRNEADAVKMGIETLKQPCSIAERVFIIRGTEAHTGPAGALDEMVGMGLSNEGFNVVRDEYNYSWKWLPAKLGGVKFDVAHHPGMGYGRPWSKGGDSNKLAASFIFEYADDPLDRPDIVVRAHNHKPSDSYDNFPTRAIISPSWKLTDMFGHRIGGSGKVLPVGGLIFLCDSGDYACKKMYFKPKRRERWVEK